MSTRAVISICQDTRRAKKDNTYPARIRVNYMRYRKYYSTGISVTKSGFKKVMGENPRGEYRITRQELEEAKREVEKVIIGMGKFTFHEFEGIYLRPSTPAIDIYSYFNEYINELKSEGRISTAITYQYAMKSIKGFSKGRTLSFEKVDVAFLKNYENHMLAKGRSAATIGMYLRSLRAIINFAQSKGVAGIYPFGKGRAGYQIKNPPARKMALSTSDLKRLFDHVPELNSAEPYYFDLWKFSYLCGGMNVKDLCLLKWDNVVQNRIMYKRQKTKHSNINGEEIVIPISSTIQKIISNWSCNSSNYVFPILDPSMTPENEYARIKQTTKQINKYINRICQKLKIQLHVTTYTARHSYATQLMRHGAPTEFISKQLGHSSIKTTSCYLENFEEKQIEEWQKKILEFNL